MKVGQAYNQSKAGRAPNGRLFTTAIFFCPQCGRIGELRLYNYIFFSFSCRKFCSAFHLNQWLAGRHFHKGIFIVSKINNIINVSIYDYRKQSAWFFPLEMYIYSFLRVLCNTHYFSDYSIKVFYGSGECLVLNIPTSDSDDIPEIVRRLEEISIGCQVKLFLCVYSYIGKHCPNLTMVGRPIIFRCD